MWPAAASTEEAEEKDLAAKVAAKILCDLDDYRQRSRVEALVAAPAGCALPITPCFSRLSQHNYAPARFGTVAQHAGAGCGLHYH